RMSDAPASARRARPAPARLVGLLGRQKPGPVDSNLGQGMEFALTVAVFLGLGWLVDGWTNTRPAFTIAFVVFSMVGQFVKMWFAYDARMQALEAERRAATQSGPRATPADSGSGSDPLDGAR
ncbi:MAG: AtpZ/AtpI family protein, partial [Ilumatobacteraceae bacterium]